MAIATQTKYHEQRERILTNNLKKNNQHYKK